jgi:hypothetical protein
MSGSFQLRKIRNLRIFVKKDRTWPNGPADSAASGVPDESWDVDGANHLLDDRNALAEIKRILNRRGFANLFFPRARTFGQTYENPAVTTRPDRELHFGQWDHIRYYGVDAAERIAAAGFQVENFSATEPSCIVTRHPAVAASSSRTNASALKPAATAPLVHQQTTMRSLCSLARAFRKARVASKFGHGHLLRSTSHWIYFESVREPTFDPANPIG